MGLGPFGNGSRKQNRHSAIISSAFEQFIVWPGAPLIQAALLCRKRCMEGGGEGEMALVAEEWWETGMRVDAGEGV